MSFPSTIYALCRSDHFFAKFVRGSAECAAAQRRFTESLAAYSIITYLLQVGRGRWKDEKVQVCGGRGEAVRGGSGKSFMVLSAAPGTTGLPTCITPAEDGIQSVGGGGGARRGRKMKVACGACSAPHW